MTEINKSEVVGEKVQPEFKQYLHMPTVCGGLAHYDLKPVISKDILRLLWWEATEPVSTRYAFSLEIYFGAKHFNDVCTGTEWMSTWLVCDAATRALFKDLECVVCRVSRSHDMTLVRMVFLFSDCKQSARPEWFAYRVAEYWRECIMRRFRFCKEVERLPMEPGLGRVAYHCIDQEETALTVFEWLMSGHRLYGDNATQAEYFCGRHIKRQEAGSL